MNRGQCVRTALVVGKGNKSNQKRHETQAKRAGRHGAAGAAAITGRVENIFRHKSVASLHGALICIMRAARVLRFALKAFYGASARPLRDVYLTAGAGAAWLHCCAPRRRCKAIADVHSQSYTVRAVCVCRMNASRVMHRVCSGAGRVEGQPVCEIMCPIHAPLNGHSSPRSRQLAQFTALWHVHPLVNHI